MFRRCFEFLWLSRWVCHRVWWPCHPFPFVIAAMSTIEPARQNSEMRTSFPRSDLAYANRSGNVPPPIRCSIKSGAFFGMPVISVGCVYVMRRTSSRVAASIFERAASGS